MALESFELLSLIAFLGVGFLAGFIDSIAGGGGLISLPGLLALGVPPSLALGTNKLQSSLGVSVATFNYASKGLVHPRPLAWGILFTAIGASAGTCLIQTLPTTSLNKVIPFLLVAVAIFFFIQPRRRVPEIQKERLSPKVFYLLFGSLLGFYDGFFGPGTGSFWMLAFSSLLGLNVLAATARTKMLNLTSNLASLLFFAINGKVLWSAGLLMAVGNMSGARLGSSLAVRLEGALIRPFVIVASLAMAAKLYWGS